MINKFNSHTKVSQSLIILTSVLLLYGYLSRLLGLYLFWESKVIGWSLLFVTIIFLLRERIQFKKLQNKKTVSENVGIGLMVFVLFIQTILLIVIPQTAAYKTANQFLKTDEFVSEHVGGVKSVFLVPTGSISTSSSANGESGQAALNFIVKGNNKFKDFRIQLVKENNSAWTIINIK